MNVTRVVINNTREDKNRLIYEPPKRGSQGAVQTSQSPGKNRFIHW